MKQISVMFEEKHIEYIDDSIREGYYPNMSDFVRTALREFFIKKGIFDMDKMGKKYKRR